MALRPLAHALPAVAEKTFSRKYVLLGRIVTQWIEIAGPDLAPLATPVGLRRHRTGKEDSAQKIHVCLEVAASSADATRLVYQKDLILERMNRIFGERLVNSIKLVHLPANTSTTPPPRFRKPLTDNQKKALSLMLETVADERVRAALENLGAAILRDSRT